MFYANAKDYDSSLLQELDLKFSNELQRWNRFFKNLPTNHPLSTNLPDEHLVEWILSHGSRRGRVLDLGCGNGRNSVYLASCGFEVDANDISDEALSITKQAAAESGVELNCIPGAFFDLAVDTESYDMIYDLGCLHHVHPHRRPQYIDFVTKGLRKDGYFILGCFNEKMGSSKSDKEIMESFNMEGGLSFSKNRLVDFFGDSFQLVKHRTMKTINDPSLGVGWDHMSISIWKKLAT